MRVRCPIPIVALVVALMAAGPVAANDDEASEQALRSVRARVAEGDWTGAHAAARAYLDGGPGRVRGVWNQLPSQLRDGARPAVDASTRRSRALAARSLEMPEVALAEHEARIALLEEAGRRIDGAKMDAAHAAHEAAIAATSAGDLDRAAALFEKVALHGITWMKEMGVERAAQVRALAAAGPDDVAAHLQLAQEVFANDRRWAQARAMVLGLLDREPTAPERRRIHELAIAWSLALSEPARAEALLADLQASDAEADAVDAATFSIAQHHVGAGDDARAAALLRAIVGGGRAGRFVPMAHIGLAEIAERANDPAAVVAHLEKAAAEPATPTGRGIMDTSDTRQLALVRLGHHFFAAGEVDRALQSFTRWKPQSWCGNGQVQGEYERDLFIARCLVAKGKAETALAGHLRPHLAVAGGELFFDDRIPALVIAIHEERRDLDGLLRWIEPHAAEKDNVTAQLARALLRIRIARRDADVDALVEELRHRSGFVPSIREPRADYRAKAASAALGELGAKAWPALRARWEQLAARAAREEANEGYGERLWVIDAVGRLAEPPAARALLRELRRRAEAGEAVGVSRDDLRFVLERAEGR